jgi:hypothetical protein
MLTRYAGFTLLPAVCAAIAMRPGAKAGAALRDAALVLAASGIPLLLWMLRNHAADGTLLGPRAAAETSFDRNTWDAYKLIVNWYLPRPLALFRAGRLPALVAGLPVAVLLVACARSRMREQLRASLTVALFAGAYLLGMIATSSMIRIDDINTRMLAPVCMPLTCLGVAGAYWIIGSSKLRPAFARAAYVVLLAAMLPHTVREAYREVTWPLFGWSEHGADRRAVFDAARARKGWMRGAMLVSNASDGLYYATGLRARWSAAVPAGSWHTHEDGAALARDMRATVRGGGRVLVIWLDGMQREYMPHPDSLRIGMRLETAVRVRDGCILASPPLRL